MNYTVIVARDNRAFTQDALDSILAQDVQVGVLAINNGSRDGIASLLASYHPRVHSLHICPQIGVAHAWNTALRFLFEECKADHVLVVNNDVVLRLDTYRLLLEAGGLFVTCVGVRGKEVHTSDGIRLFDNKGTEVFPGDPQPKVTRPHPDFSCYLIRREVWERVGPFDEQFKGGYCEDWDYHVRLHRAGIGARCIDVPFYHRGAATVATAQGSERERIHAQAKVNRAYFKQKWGVEGGSQAYYEIFGHEAPTEGPPTLAAERDNEV